MFLTEEQLNERLNNPRNLANRIKGGKHASSRIPEAENQIFAAERPEEEKGIQFREIKRPGNNRTWLSQSERTEIAIASIGEKQTEVARRYGVEVSTVSDIVNNARRVENGPRSTDQLKVDMALDAVRVTATNKLQASLNLLTEDKISGHNAKDISAICANMAKVVQQTIPQEKGGQSINLIVYTPELRKEANFDSVEV